MKLLGELGEALMMNETNCCIVGGGPAGVMLGYLLARQGVAVTVLEKHADFNRDFRGDTVHPSTLEVLRELGLLDDFLKLPHQKVTSAGGLFGDFEFRAADFAALQVRTNFVALMPQWDFLEFLSSRARRFPSFDLRMRHEVVGLLREQGRVSGVIACTPEGMIRIRAGLVVGCDGRYATTRSDAQFEVIETGVPIDVLWFRISRQARDPEQVFGIVNYGRALILINRGDYFQAGMIIRKGSFDTIKQNGLDAFRATIARMAPYLASRTAEIRDWEQVKLLSVQINHLRRWHRAGLLCIGDAAHAMSPAGGVGINLAIQDAVAAARLLAQPFRDGRVTGRDLARVQARRAFPALVTQFLQARAHRGLESVFQQPGPAEAPWQMRLALQIPGFQKTMARIIGLGIRPERIEQPGSLHEAAVRLGGAIGKAHLWLRGLSNEKGREAPRFAGVQQTHTSE